MAGDTHPSGLLLRWTVYEITIDLFCHLSALPERLEEHQRLHANERCCATYKQSSPAISIRASLAKKVPYVFYSSCWQGSRYLLQYRTLVPTSGSIRAQPRKLFQRKINKSYGHLMAS